MPEYFEEEHLVPLHLTGSESDRDGRLPASASPRQPRPPHPLQDTVNPHVELQSLLDVFPQPEPMLTDAEHVASETRPEPYRRMLAHNHHMTVTMESYHNCRVDVRILDRKLDGDFYSRKIVLLKSGTDRVVQFGIGAVDLSYVTPVVRRRFSRGKSPSAACSSITTCCVTSTWEPCCGWRPDRAARYLDAAGKHRPTAGSPRSFAIATPPSTCSK